MVYDSAYKFFLFRECICNICVLEIRLDIEEASVEEIVPTVIQLIHFYSELKIK